MNDASNIMTLSAFEMVALEYVHVVIKIGKLSYV